MSGEKLELGMTFPKMVQRELRRARTIHPVPLASAHEGSAVIREEHEEMWDEVKRKDRGNLQLLKELIQLAAMCQRMAEDVLGIEGEGAQVQ